MVIRIKYRISFFYCTLDTEQSIHTLHHHDYTTTHTVEIGCFNTTAETCTYFIEV